MDDIASTYTTKTTFAYWLSFFGVSYRFDQMQKLLHMRIESLFAHFRSLVDEINPFSLGDLVKFPIFSVNDPRANWLLPSCLFNFARLNDYRLEIWKETAFAQFGHVVEEKDRFCVSVVWVLNFCRHHKILGNWTTIHHTDKFMVSFSSACHALQSVHCGWFEIPTIRQSSGPRQSTSAFWAPIFACITIFYAVEWL